MKIKATRCHQIFKKRQGSENRPLKSGAILIEGILLSTIQMPGTYFYQSSSSILVYHFVSMHSIFALPGWRHKCSLKKWGLVILDRYFGEGMETNSADKKVKRRECQNSLLKLCVQTFFSSLFYPFSPALLLSIPSPKYQS